MTFLLGAGWSALVPAAMAWIYHMFPPQPRLLTFLAMWTAEAAAGFGITAACRWWPGVTGTGISLAVALFLLHRRRRRRKRAPRALGAKGRAALAALVRRMRESAAPRGALRPVPQGT